MDAPCSSQLILGIDKRNPLFAVYQDPERQQLHVYYGFELLDIVPVDPEAPTFKLLAGRLYNAGLKIQSLSEVFGVDRKTLQRWGRALRSGDAEELIRVLAGGVAQAVRQTCVGSPSCSASLRELNLRILPGQTGGFTGF